MNTNTRNLLASVRQLSATAEHLAVFADLPAPVLVTVNGAWCIDEAVSFQLDCETSIATLSASLLAWADTLTDVNASAWRHTSDPDYMHLYLSGRLTDGTLVSVYGAVAYAPVLDLAPATRGLVDLAQLEQWAAGRAVAA